MKAGSSFIRTALSLVILQLSFIVAQKQQELWKIQGHWHSHFIIPYLDTCIKLVIKISLDFLSKKPYITYIHATTCHFFFLCVYRILWFIKKKQQPLRSSCQTAPLGQYSGQQRPCVWICSWILTALEEITEKACKRKRTLSLQASIQKSYPPNMCFSDVLLIALLC